jgi:hypothetical protein
VRLLWQVIFALMPKRRIDGGGLDQGDTDQSMIALELHAQGIDERLNSMFSGAIDTLRRNGEIGEDACPCWSGSRRP